MPGTPPPPGGAASSQLRTTCHPGRWKGALRPPADRHQIMAQFQSELGVGELEQEHWSRAERHGGGAVGALSPRLENQALGRTDLPTLCGSTPWGTATLPPTTWFHRALEPSGRCQGILSPLLVGDGGSEREDRGEPEDPS